MPLTLLEHLTFDFQRGEALAAALGVTRAAVHKAVHALEGAGYPLETSRLGYRLSPGTPAPRLLERSLKGGFGRPYTYLGRVDSTQDVLRARAEAGALEGEVVLAETQIHGRGRRGRSWHSPPGSGLYFSLLLRPDLPLERLPLLTLAAGVALAGVCPVGQLKWPNDLLAPDGRKLAGILLEGELRGEELRGVSLGIGLNVHRSAGLEGAALDDFGAVQRLGVLVELLDALERWLYAPPEQVLSAWKARNCTLGRSVRLPGSPTHTATARDLDPSGALLVEAGGQLERITAGEVQLVGVFKDTP